MKPSDRWPTDTAELSRRGHGPAEIGGELGIKRKPPSTPPPRAPQPRDEARVGSV